MDFIQSVNKQVDKFGAGKHGFSPGNPGAGVQATYVSSLWCDDLQQELINVIEGAGLVPAAATPTQMKQAIEIMIRKMSGSVCVAGGTADVITGDFAPDVTVLVHGMRVRVRAALANLTAAPTFQADATAAKTIVKGGNKPLVPGDIDGAGHWLEFEYDLTLDKYVLLNPASGVKGLGFDQTWQNLTASRAISTVYTNTTGRPISIKASVSGTVASSTVSVSWTVQGVANIGSASLIAGATPANTTVGADAVVPPGATYSLAVTQGSLTVWNELR